MTVELALQLLLALANQAGNIAAAIQDAKAKGQTTLTADQWDAIIESDNAARAALADAIKRSTTP